MLEALVLKFALPIFAGLLLSGLLEQVFTPRPQWLWSRRRSAIAIHVGLWLLVFVIEFAQFRRPWLSAAIVTVIYLVLLLINQAKYQALREPFLYQDFDYFLDMIKHPRLYLPFFGVPKIVACMVLALMTLYVGAQSETPLTARYPLDEVWSLCAAILLLAGGVLWLGHTHYLNRPELAFEPVRNLVEDGLLGLLWRYGVAERVAPVNYTGLSALPSQAGLVPPGAETPPDIVVVQSESFFDPRHSFKHIDPTVLRHFDRLSGQAAHHGRLLVEAWGANTVRTEFSFLTGIATPSLGVDQFNPYRRLISGSTPSLARLLQQRGYRTVCVHPYPASFYQRARVFPLLGFDDFIDIKAFDAPSVDGAYISDALLTNKVIQLLNDLETNLTAGATVNVHASAKAQATAARRPLFIFVITMENHGPLHLETLAQSEQQRWLTQPLPSGCGDLSVYLKHLAQADQMIARLTAALSAGERPGILAWYGDHVPVMAKVYDTLGAPDGATNYFVWSSASSLSNPSNPSGPSSPLTPAGASSQLAQNNRTAKTMHVSQLARTLYDLASNNYNASTSPRL